MDAKEFGPALVAVADLCHRANQLINGDRSILAVRVTPRFKGGSFEFSLEVVQTITGAMPLFPMDVRDVTYVLVTLGLLDSPTAKTVLSAGANLLKFLKWLHGKTNVRTSPPNQNGVVTVTAGDNSTVNVHVNVIQAADDHQVRRAVNGVAKPLENPGIERLDVKQEKRIVERVTREELPAMRPATVDTELAVELPDEERDTVVEVVKVAFNEAMAWEFSEGGGSHFPAVVKDETFLERVHNREVAFAKGDAFRVRLQTKKFHTASGLRSEIRVLRVFEELPAPRQRPLFPESGDR